MDDKKLSSQRLQENKKEGFVVVAIWRVWDIYYARYVPRSMVRNNGGEGIGNVRICARHQKSNSFGQKETSDKKNKFWKSQTDNFSVPIQCSTRLIFQYNLVDESAMMMLQISYDFLLPSSP